LLWLFVFLVVSMLYPQPAFSAHFTPQSDDRGKASIDPSQANYKEGLKRYKDKDYDGAIDSFLQAIYFARNNYFPDAYYNLGLSYARKHQDEKAIKAMLTHLQQVVGPSYEAHCDLAELYIRNDRLDDAREQADEALSDSMGQHNGRALYVSGKIFEALGNLPDARGAFRDALGDRPWRFTDAWMALAEVNMKMKDWGGAADHLNDMIKAQDDLRNFDAERVYLDLGLCLVQKGDHQGAFECWRKAEAVNPNSAKAHLSIAKLFDQEQHISSAIEEYQAYLRVAPAGKDADAVKNRLVVLNQKINPPDIDPQPIKPTPAMRKQQAEQQAADQAQKEEKREQGSDSGF
jgi:tetratricopeptide (TPR) repeat protein